MKEVKSPKKPLIYYYGIVLLVIFLFNIIFNMFILPSMYQQQVVEVDYGKFMDMIDAKDIGMVQVEDTQILFTDKEGTSIYETVPMDDPTLTERLHEAGAQFTRVMEEPASPLMSLFLTTILPITDIRWTGAVHEQEADKPGGRQKCMTFGKSNAKVYVPSTQGIRFTDVAAKTRPKRACRK